MRFDIITLFPDLFGAVRDHGVTGRAYQRDLWSMGLWNPRDYTRDVHRTVDDRPYGGGPGMVMLIDPLEQALAQARAAQPESAGEVILLSPAGTPFSQSLAEQLSGEQGLVMVCGRYEGIDQRFINRHVTMEISIGDYVLSGGEIPALAVIDCLVRLQPGVLHDADSAEYDSFSRKLSGLLDSPHYTRPEVHSGDRVPPQLLSGNHQHIAEWRRQQSLKLTALRRPDLIAAARSQGLLSPSDEAFLASVNCGAGGPRGS